MEEISNSLNSQINETEFRPEEKINLEHNPKALYELVEKIYNDADKYSRLLTVSKLIETNEKNEKLSIDTVFNTISSEIKLNLEKPFNAFIIMIGTYYTIILLEVFLFLIKTSGDKLLDYLKKLNNNINANKSIQSEVNVISFIEDVLI